MQRILIEPRADWQQKVEAAGLTFHSPADLASAQPGGTYWDESACYQFTAAEIDGLEKAANDLQGMCLAAAQHVIDHNRFHDLTIPAEAVPHIVRTWNSEPPALYGRFDLMFDGSGPPKLLEYNADTPTSLMEAAVVQWSWLQDVFPPASNGGRSADQFNSIHERLIAKWRDITPHVQGPVYFSSADTEEDVLTAAYLRDTAQQAGLRTEQLLMEEIGWDDDTNSFVDLNEQPISTLFKLYPWESMLAEEFGPAALAFYDHTVWIEPIWKMLFANKGILAILWELYPDHPYLLESRFDSPGAMTSYVQKPLLSREGSNITLVTPQGTTRTPGPYGGGRFVFQQMAPTARFDLPSIDALTAPGSSNSRYPVLGLWMIDQECGGMGIRESASPITGNLSSFVPHFFR